MSSNTEPSNKETKAGKKDSKGAGTKVAAAAPKKLEETVKIWGVVKYASDLYRSFYRPANFTKLRPNDLVFNLFAKVWPTADNPEGQREVWSLFILAIVRTFLLHHSANLGKELTRTVYTRDTRRFSELVRQGALLVGIGATFNALNKFSQERLYIAFREKLTSRIHAKYFNGMTYYHLRNPAPGKKAIPDPEDRLCREVPDLARRLTTFVSNSAQALPCGFFFFLRLWYTAGLRYALLPMIYHCLAYEAAQRYFPKNIGILLRQNALASNEYRSAVGRVQRHCEAITALGGAKLESDIVQEKFAKVLSGQREAYWAMSKFNIIFKLAYVYGFRPWIYLFVCLTPWFAGGSMSRGGGGFSMQMGEVRRLTHMMIEMLVSNGMLMTVHATGLHIQGIAKRVDELIKAVDDLNVQKKQDDVSTFVEGDDIAFENVQIVTPTGNKLVQDLSFKIPKGSSLLLTGHNGAGKSSIFRCLGGLWTVPQGKITKPGAGTAGLNAAVFYLPQKPYNVYGTLAEQITYPADQGGISQKQVHELLKLFDLSHLVESAKPDEVLNWEERLSLGEQQRLAMARLFFHKPQYVVLDECTSAVDSAMEQLLYNKCRDSGITYITISHRPVLKAWHKLSLNLTGDGKGSWEYNAIDSEEAEENRKQAMTRQMQAGVSKASSRGSAAQVLDELSEQYAAQTKIGMIPTRTAAARLWQILRIVTPGTRFQTFSLLGLICLRTLCFEGYARLNAKMFEAMIQLKPGTLVSLSFLLFLQDFAAAWIDEAVEWLQKEISVLWHERLQSRIVDLWFSKRRYYKLGQIDGRVGDADQVIAQEMQELSTQFTAIWGSAIRPLADILFFSLRLVRVLGASGAAQLNIYNVVVWTVLRRCMPDHTSLANREKKAESKYHFIQSRLKDHCESIAFFGGGDRERQIADDAFAKVQDAARAAHKEDAQYKLVFSAITRDATEHSRLVTTPLMLQSWLQLQFTNVEKSTMSEGSLASGATYVDVVIERTITAFGQLTGVLEDASKLVASASRVTDLINVLAELDEGPSEDYLESSGGSKVEIRDLDLVTPKGICFAAGLNLTLEKGQSLMITGPNACGKTSFFRVMAGMWPIRSGSVSRPDGIMLVPQRVYSVSGNLPDQVTYPQRHRPCSEDVKLRVLDALDLVGLSYLIDREGWEKESRWEDVLSLGEQQRIGLSRLFFHRPSVGVLDECTSAVSVDAEEKMLGALHATGIDCITISQRLALEQFHQVELQLGSSQPQGWRLQQIQSI